VFAVVFVAAMPALWLWRWIARRAGARTTLMLAYGAFGLAALPLGIVNTLLGAVITAAFIGVGLAGMLLMGDVILCDVIDEDELRTGRRREGMYFGMSGMIIFLSQALAAVVFGWVTSAYGYDSALAAQPPSVATGFRVYMTVPTFIGAALAVVALAFYPLHGARLAQVKEKLAARPNR
jgi:GPH family glycoside/pentoside/hexuronide:cation symporter